MLKNSILKGIFAFCVTSYIVFSLQLIADRRYLTVGL